MRLGGPLTAVLGLLCAAALGACGDGEERARPALPDELPLDDPCGWLTTDEAAAAFEAAGVEIGNHQVRSVVQPSLDPDYDDNVSCLYGWDVHVAMVKVILSNQDGVASSVRDRVAELRAHPESDADSGAYQERLVTLADLPATTQGMEANAGNVLCLVSIPTEGDGLVSLGIGAPGDDGPALCPPAIEAAEKLVERLKAAQR